MPIYLPVDPSRDEEKRLRVLYPLFKDAARPYPDDPPAVTAGTGLAPETKYYQTTARAALNLGLGDLFKFGADGFYDALIMDTVVGIPKYRTGVIPPEIKVLGTYWGFSVRVVMKFRSLQLKGDLNLSMLAAAVELNSAEIQYAVTAVGVDRQIFATALRSVPLFGKLDYATYARLQAGLDELGQALAGRVSSQPLLPIGVFVRDDPFDRDVLSDGRSVRWPMIQIANRIRWSEAVAKAPSWVDRDILTRVYGELVGKNLEVPVAEATANTAREWLRVE